MTNQKRLALLLVLVFASATLTFHYSVQMKKSTAAKESVEEKQETLVPLRAAPRAGKLQPRRKMLQERLDPSDMPVEFSQLLKPNLTEHAELPRKQAFAALVHHYLAPWLHPDDHFRASTTTHSLRPYGQLTQRALDTMEFSYKGGAFRVRIRSGRLFYRKLVFWRQTYRSQRMQWYLHLLHDMVRENSISKDIAVDFVVYVGDGPKVAADTFTTDAGFPLFSLRTSDAHVDIPVPDPVSHGSNGNYLWSDGGKAVPWMAREQRVVFRGRGSCLKMQADNWHVCNRVRAQKMSRECADLLDMGVIEWNQIYSSRIAEQASEAEIEMTAGVKKVAPMDFDKQSRYRYILDLDGGLGSSRKPGILESGSVLFAQDSPWYTFYEPLLQPYRHYIPVDRYLRDLTGKVRWAISHDRHAQWIQQNGAAFAAKYLSLEASKDYLAVLLAEYQRIQAFQLAEAIEPVQTDFCERMSGSQGASEVQAGPMGCSRDWLEYTGEGSIPDHVINDRAAFKARP